MRIVGTRTAIGGSIISLIDGVVAGGDIVRLDIASAYWDARAFDYALELAERLGGPVRLVVWTAGGSRASWQAARALDRTSEVELRFIDSPADGGIFHAKVAGAARADGSWAGAFVGSGNLTDAALRRNVELGAWIDGSDVGALGELRAWFDELFDAATPATDIDWDRALSVVPEQSEAARRNKIFREAALAAPAPATPVEAERSWVTVP
jgi:phosphatidylserine/phosphatidylglycerophosphate/cardiolipin synthase-like enzyme